MHCGFGQVTEKIFQKNQDYWMGKEVIALRDHIRFSGSHAEVHKNARGIIREMRYWYFPDDWKAIVGWEHLDYEVYYTPDEFGCLLILREVPNALL